ncbi:MAG: hypothetical protein ACTH31_13880 [Pseudoclavibacter sp.]
MRNSTPLTFLAIAGAAALLTACSATPSTSAASPGVTIDAPASSPASPAGDATPTGSSAPNPTASSSAPPAADDDANGDDSGSGSGSAAGAGASLPSPVTSIEYEIDAPGQDDDDDDRTASDAQQLSDFTEVLEFHGITSNYEREEDCDNDWEVEVDAHLENGSTIQIDLEVCTPNDFENDLITLLNTWP